MKESQLTLSEWLRLLRYKPVSSFNVHELEAREELPDQGQDLIRHVLALCAPHEQRRLHKPRLARVPEGEVPHIVERAAQDVEGHAELLPLGRVTAHRAVEVPEEELPYGQRLLVLCEDLVCLGLPGHAGVLDAPHPAHVPRKVLAKDLVHRRVVHRRDVGDEVGAAEGERHGRLSAHRVADDARVPEAVLPDEVGDI